MKVTIKYKGSELVIQGDIREAEPEFALFKESFDIIEMKCNDVEVHDNYDEDDYYDIVQLCLKEAKKEHNNES